MNFRTYFQAGTAAILAASLTAYPAMPGRSAEGPSGSPPAVAPVHQGDTARVLQALSLSKNGYYEEALGQMQKIADDPSASKVERGMAQEGVVSNLLLLGKRDEASKALDKLNAEGLPFRIAFSEPDAKKSNSFDPGIEAACGDLSLDPKIEMQTANLSIDPKMVNRMDASDGSNGVLIDPSIIGGGEKLRSELGMPPAVPRAK